MTFIYPLFNQCELVREASSGNQQTSPHRGDRIIRMTNYALECQEERKGIIESYQGKKAHFRENIQGGPL